MRYLIDTNIWVFYLKERWTPVRRHLENTAPPLISVASVVWAELLAGAERYGNATERKARVEEVLAPFACLPFDLAAARRYGPLRYELEKRGESIGRNDLMIASIALAHDLILVTNNEAEFGRIKNLRVEDWSR
jgi:tRNA(fMet)-specific endonuclease VapC